MAKRIDEADISPVIARKIAARASGADEAIVVGNRAGVIEWANAAWTKVTGFPVDDAISKPIGWLLDAAEIEPTVVDFVQRHFRTGRRCEVELPVTTPDGRAIWVHLDVEPFKDELGEISDFVAVATDITTRREGELAFESRIAEALAESEALIDGDPGSSARARVEAEIEQLAPALALARIAETVERARTPHAGEIDRAGVLDDVLDRAKRELQRGPGGEARLAETDVDVLTREAIGDARRRIPRSVLIDVDLAQDLPTIRIDAEGLDEIVRGLLECAGDAIGDEWGTISVTTGVAEPGIALTSTVDPTIDRFPLTTDRPHVFVELHDTAISLSRAARQFAQTREGPRPDEARTLALALAAAQAERIGGALRVHSVAGIGTRVILYLPVG
jgi:hypothetical protein